MQHNFYHSHKPVQIQGAGNTSHLLIGERAKNTVGRHVMGDKEILLQTFLDNTVSHVLHFDHSNLHTSHRHISYLVLLYPQLVQQQKSRILLSKSGPGSAKNSQVKFLGSAS